MQCVWDHEEKTVHEIHECLSGKRKIAYTTVMTIMTRLAGKGLLKRKKEGKAFIYSAKNTKKQTAKSMVGNIFNLLVDQFGEEAIVAFSDEVDKVSRRNRGKQ